MESQLPILYQDFMAKRWRGAFIWKNVKKEYSQLIFLRKRIGVVAPESVTFSGNNRENMQLGR